jgi:hypothetical protein
MTGTFLLRASLFAHLSSSRRASALSSMARAIASRSPFPSDFTRSSSSSDGSLTSSHAGCESIQSLTSLDFHGGKSPNDSGPKHRIFRVFGNYRGIG